MSNKLELDFVVYLGDPDEGAEALSSKELLEKADQHKEELDFPEAYGALTISKDGKELVERKADPIFKLVTNLVRAVPYVIEGEPETRLLTESEFGYSFEPSGDEIFVSFFAGDAFEPEEFLLPATEMDLDSFGEQVLAMGDRLKGIIEKADPGAFEDDYMKGLIEFLDVGNEAFKQFRLQKQRGLRVQ